MRIGILTDLYLPHISGITIFVSMYRSALESFGHEAHIFTFGPRDFSEEDPFVHRTPGIRIGKSGFYFNPRHAPPNQKLLRSMDLLHTMHPFVSGTLAFLYRRDPSTPVVFTSQTRYDLYIRHTLPAPIRPPARLLLREFMPGFCRRCSLVIAPSAGGEAMLRSLGVKRNVEIIPNAVDLEIFRPAEKFRAGRIRAVYTGRLAAEKNLPFLLRAFAIAASRCASLELAIIGDGPQRSALEELVRSLGMAARVNFLGERPHSELPALLADYDLFLTASLTEVHPLSLIEAMAAGLPAVAVETPGISETVRDGANGLLAANSPEDFAEKICRIAADPELGRTLAAGAARTAQAFDIRDVTRRHLEKFAALLPGGTPSMASRNRLLGEKGERAAAEHLSARGYTILARNLRTASGELDLVAQAGEFLVFVEVKTRRGRSHGLPEEAITPRKKKHLLGSAQHYLQENGLMESPWRIDVVAIEYSRAGTLEQIEVFENAVGG